MHSNICFIITGIMPERYKDKIMIIHSKTMMGFQCPSCGKIQIQELSAFSFADNQRHQILCDHCHQIFAAIHAGDKGEYQIQAVCLDCCSAHVFSVKRGLFWLEHLREFRCPQTDELILAVGDEEKIEALLADEFYLNEEDLEDEGLDQEDFDQMEYVMTQLVALFEHFKHLEQCGKITCVCGQPQIQVQYAGGWVLLSCLHCRRELRMDVSDYEKILAVQNIDEICLSDKPTYKK